MASYVRLSRKIILDASPNQQLLANKRGQVLKYDGPAVLIEDPMFAGLHELMANQQHTSNLGSHLI